MGGWEKDVRDPAGASQLPDAPETGTPLPFGVCCVAVRDLRCSLMGPRLGRSVFGDWAVGAGRLGRRVAVVSTLC